jgi:hypothetical protein
LGVAGTCRAAPWVRRHDNGEQSFSCLGQYVHRSPYHERLLPMWQILMHAISLTILAFAFLGGAFARPASAILDGSREVSQSLFNSLEELARLVDISYCVGSTGIQKPFSCLSRCNDFQGFELITVCKDTPPCLHTNSKIVLRHGILDLFSPTPAAISLFLTLHIRSGS